MTETVTFEAVDAVVEAQSMPWKAPPPILLIRVSRRPPCAIRALLQLCALFRSHLTSAVGTGCISTQWDVSRAQSQRFFTVLLRLAPEVLSATVSIS